MTKITKTIFNELCLSLEKAVAMYQLLHLHAAGQTDLTEDQLANVVTGVSIEAREVLRRARGGRPSRLTRAWVPDALSLASAPVRHLNG